MSIHVTSRVLVPSPQFLEHWGENTHVFAGVLSGYYFRIKAVTLDQLCV